MNTNSDEVIIDLDSDPHEEVMKGKAPRRLMWVFGLAFLFILVFVGIIVVNNKEPEKKLDQQKITQDKLKKDNMENSQIVASLQATQQSGFENDKPQSSSLSGELTQLTSGIGSTDTTMTQDNADAIAKSRNLEKIRTGPMFRNGMSRTGGIQNMVGGSKGTSGDQEIMNQISEIAKQQQDKFAKQNSPEEAIKRAMEQAGVGGGKPKTNADIENDFNKQMQGKQLPAPTGVLEKSNSQCLLRPGWLIPVANIEKMNSDIPGEITLLVRRNVYGSYNSSCLAIPAGSTIIASYNPNVAVGQERFNIAATVMHLPNGKKVPMMGTNAYELDGSAGTEAEVNNHFFKILGTSLALGVASRLIGNDQVSSSSSGGGTTTTGSALSKIVGESAEVILKRNKDIQPTLTRDGATRFNLKISREFFMENYND